MRRNGEDGHGVRNVINRCKIERFTGGKDREAEGAALTGVDVGLAYEFAFLCKFDDLARMSRVRIGRVAVGGEQVTVRRENQRQGAAKMRVFKDEIAFVCGRRPSPSGGNRVDARQVKSSCV